jgi:dipeptidyl-peptidase 4
MPDRFTHETTSITIEDVASLPLPGMAVPGSLAFSPDDRLIAYLHSPDHSLERRLYAFDPQSGEHRLLTEPPEGLKGEEDISPEEALRRERQRQLETGVTQYAWAEHSNRLLVPYPGEVYVSDGPGSPLRRLVGSSGSQAIRQAESPQISPDGEWVAYVQDSEVYVVPFAGGAPRQLTHGGRETRKTNGLAEYIAQEEMDRHSGLWWSPDSRWVAFEQVDENHIPVYRIVHQGKGHTGSEAQEDHHYPFAGGPNATVRLGVVSIEGGEPVWMDLGAEPDVYLARVQWLPDGRLSAQVENRRQTQLDLLVFNPQTGQGKILLQETSPVWINLHDLFYPLEHPYRGETGCFLWAAERSGFRHLYLYDAQGKRIRQLTSGDWMVDSLAGVNETAGLVYFTATLEDPRQSHLYVVPLEGGQPRRLTQELGTHSVVLDHACKRFIDTWQTLDHPPAISLRSLEDGSLLGTLYAQHDPRLDRLRLEPPELVSLPNRNGTRLYAALFRPPGEFGPGPYPTVVFVYGGPHVQLVVDAWSLTVNMRLQYLRSLGFLVFVLDNRGSARRGLAFEAEIRYDMGHAEVEDQVDGVNWLVAHGLADPHRVGVCGWSYGGYMAAMCLARAPEVFKVAVAGAPVTHWDGYDTFYTERYMGAPQENQPGYQVSSVMQHIPNLRGRLMLVHGLIDENVHFRHTARLINALIAARKPYDLLVFPDERHMPRKLADRIFMEERVSNYFLEHLREQDV